MTRDQLRQRIIEDVRDLADLISEDVSRRTSVRCFLAMASRVDELPDDVLVSSQFIDTVRRVKRAHGYDGALTDGT